MSKYIESGHKRNDQDFYPTLQAKEMVRDLVLCAGISIPPVAWEPHAGEGHLVDALKNMNIPVYASDIEPRAKGVVEMDFLAQERLPSHQIRSIVMNPPFSSLDAQLGHALKLMQPVTGTVLMLARTLLTSGKKRQSNFRNHPHFAAKIEMVGRPFWFTDYRNSPIHPYSWYLWDFSKEHPLPAIKWIDPL